jgi:S-methylmethionine-dependent homocysteine/selenocysteine methylase
VAQGLAELEALQPEYQQLAAAMAPHVDLFVCETMCTSGEAAAAGTAAAGAGRPWWAAFTLEDSEKGLLRGGEPLAAAVRAIGQLPGLEAVLVNCCAPQAATAALPTLREAAPAHVAVGAYANGFLRTTSDWLEEGSSAAHLVRPPADEYDSHGVVLPEAYAAHARRWVELGAGIVGGCCGVGPEHVARLAALKAAGGNTASLRSPSRV